MLRPPWAHAGRAYVIVGGAPWVETTRLVCKARFQWAGERLGLRNPLQWILGYQATI
jgi:hypothetical protein